MNKFALLGVGYIAQRHIDAIEATNNNLVLIYDNSSKIKTSHAKNNIKQASSEEEFFSLVSSLQVDYVVICTPSHLHHKQILKSFRAGSQVIVEKPICLTLNELNEIISAEQKSGLKALSLFQLRYHQLIKKFPNTDHNQIQITYQGKRDEAYYNSWKGNLKQSGGIVAAVGIHYFDMLTLKYGNFIEDSLQLEFAEEKRVKGILELECASVKFDFEFLPQNSNTNLKREFIINNNRFDFSNYNKDLHTIAYETLLAKKGITSEETRKSLEIMEAINTKLLQF